VVLVQHKLLYIEHALLDTISRRVDFVREFPFFSALQQSQHKAATCGCHGANQIRRDGYQGILATIAGMGQEQKRKLKNMLNARQIRLTYRGPRNQIIQLTF
jgi:hypothetical protein